MDVFGHQVNISAYLQEIFQSYREIAIVFSEHIQTPEEMTFSVMYIPFLLFHDTKIIQDTSYYIFKVVFQQNLQHPV